MYIYKKIRSFDLGFNDSKEHNDVVIFININDYLKIIQLSRLNPLMYL